MDTRWTLLPILVLLAGCVDESTSIRDVVPPAAPRGVHSVTGDREVVVRWLSNTEPDVAGYRIYQAPCERGGDCPYDQVGSTSGLAFTVTGLVNGETRYYAVAAFDRSGNESELSYEPLYDTPRPEGTGQWLDNYLEVPAGSGYDFSGFTAADWNDLRTDMFFGFNGGVYQMFVPDYQTDIQDAGYAGTLDAVDFAPSSGWSPTGSVELIVGHCYVVWTRDDHYAKFRVTEIRPPLPGVPASVRFDWAYQVDPGNRELRSSRVKDGRRGMSRPLGWIDPQAHDAPADAPPPDRRGGY